MKYYIYSVFDSAIGAYLPPLVQRSTGEALRSFEAAIRDQQHDFFRNSKDYSLFYMADWEDTTGEFTLLAVPVCIAKAHEVVARLQQSASLTTEAA